MRYSCILASLVIVLTLNSCSSKDTVSESTTLTITPSGIYKSNGSLTNPVDNISTMLKKVANLRIQVDNQLLIRNKIDSLANTMHALISKESINKSNYGDETRITIRVPVAQFERMVNSICASAISLDEKDIDSEEMSAQYSDLNAQISSRNLLKKSYLELLKRANKMTDILEIQGKVGSLQEEINRMESNRILMENQVDYSTIHLSYYLPTINKEPGYFVRLLQSFYKGWHFMEELTIALATLWPLSIAAIFILLVAKRKSILRLRNTI